MNDFTCKLLSFASNKGKLSLGKKEAVSSDALASFGLCERQFWQLCFKIEHFEREGYHQHILENMAGKLAI